MLERRTRDRKFGGSILDIHSRMRLKRSDSNFIKTISRYIEGHFISDWGKMKANEPGKLLQTWERESFVNSGFSVEETVISASAIPNCGVVTTWSPWW